MYPIIIFQMFLLAVPLFTAEGNLILQSKCQVDILKRVIKPAP